MEDIGDPIITVGPHWRHEKRGSAYVEVGRGHLRHRDQSVAVIDGAELVAYRGEDGSLCFRTSREFDDGRFSKLCDGETRSLLGLKREVMEAWQALAPDIAGDPAAMAEAAVGLLSRYLTGLPDPIKVARV
jgi:hypothetical protein